MNENNEIIKIKGSNVKISFDEMKSILNNQTVEIKQKRWIKNYKNGNISIEDIIYHLSITENKRLLIKDNNNIIIDSKPFI